MTSGVRVLLTCSRPSINLHIFFRLCSSSSTHDPQSRLSSAANSVSDSGHTHPSSSSTEWSTIDHMREHSPRVHPSVERMIRVNHAGERAAQMMSTGQAIASGRRMRKQKQLLREPHTSFFEKEVRRKRVRPSLLLPLWDMAGLVCGLGSAVLGSRSPVSSSGTVQTAISDHYNSQLRELLASDFGDVELLEGIKRCRDTSEESCERSDQSSNELLQVDAVTQLVRSGCRLAVWVSERV